jgi:chromosome segregation and condensation protein ScpB
MLRGLVGASTRTETSTQTPFHCLLGSHFAVSVPIMALCKLPEPPMLHCFNFANFWKPSSPISEVSEASEPETVGDRPLEELAGAQALGVDLKEAAMACLSGAESRRWTVGELVERFKDLGISASRASVTAALAELELELELAPWAPWHLVERGTEWILAPKSELMERLLATRKVPLKVELSEGHKAVLLVVIGHRRKGGVPKTRIAEILALDPSPFLDDLLRQELVYADPAREINFWRPTRGALLALGLSSSADIPALKELEDWFESLGTKSATAPHTKLDSYLGIGEQRSRKPVQGPHKLKIGPKTPFFDSFWA